MNVTDARAWLTARSSRVRTEAGEVMIGIPLDTAAEIAALLPSEAQEGCICFEPAYETEPTCPVHGKVPEPALGAPGLALEVEKSPVVVEPTPEPEKVVDTESGPVKVPRKKAKKRVAKKNEKRRKR